MRRGRLARRGGWRPLGLVAAAVAAAAWLLVADPGAPAAAPATTTRLATHDAPSAVITATTSAAGAVDAADVAPSSTDDVAERSVATVRHALSAGQGPGPLLDLFARAAVDDPHTRAMALTALGRYPRDPQARAAVLTSLSTARPREERLLAVSVAQGMLQASGPRSSGGDWAAAALRAIVAEGADPQLTAAARAALERHAAADSAAGER